MWCQSFQFFAGLFALTFASGLTTLHAGDEAALDTGAIETITGLKGVSNQSEGTFKKFPSPGMMSRSLSSTSAWLHLWDSRHRQPSLQAQRAGSSSWVMWFSSRMK